MVEGTRPVKKFSESDLRRATAVAPTRSFQRTEAKAYSSIRRVSEMMPAGNGPVSMFAFKVLAGQPRIQRRSMHCVFVRTRPKRRGRV